MFSLRIPIFLLLCLLLFCCPGALSAATDDPVEQERLGWNYEHGVEVGQDYQLAMQWYMKAASQGYAPAQRAVGKFHELGLGVTADPAVAAHYYRQAAEQGLARAQANLGLLYENGLGVQQDYSQAVAWYTKAAARHNPRGLYLLARMYEQGLGVTKDQDAAQAFYQKAANSGYEKAGQRLKRITASTGPEDSASPSASASASDHFFRGNSLMGQGRYQEAVTAYEMALALEPDNVNTVENVAIAHARQGKTKKAISIMERCVQLAPMDGAKWASLGILYHSLGEEGTATLHYDKALALNGDIAVVHHNLAFIQAARADYVRAWQSLERAAELGTDAPALRERLAKTLPSLPPL